MRQRALTLAIVAWALSAPAVALADTQITPNTLRPGEGEPLPGATLADVAWLEGSWVGSGLGGEVEELWAAPSGGSMMGAFKLLRDGEPSFYELMLILETEGSLELRLKHFNPDITGWEEKDDSVSFPLVKVEEGSVYFRGLTYRRDGADRLRVFLALRRGDETEEVAFSFNRRR